MSSKDVTIVGFISVFNRNLVIEIILIVTRKIISKINYEVKGMDKGQAENP